MTDTLYLLVAVTGVEGDAAATAAIENLRNNEQGFEVLETITDDGATGDPVIYFP